MASKQQTGANPAPANPPLLQLSGIRDNFSRGTVGEFLEAALLPGSSLAIVSAYFTIYAFEALKHHLSSIEGLRFLFGEPRFLKNLDPGKNETKSFKIEDEEILLANRLEQRRIAKECADWISEKVEIRSIRHANLLHGKMYHIEKNGVETAILGSSNFTVRGLGLAPTGNNIELNLEVDSNRDRRDLKNWFDELWAKLDLVEDVKDNVLRYLQQLYVNHPPEFIYYKTLYHIFEKYLGEQEKGGLLDTQQIVDSEIWNWLYEFQKDGVKGAINKINTHNGCIIADSVGLGKTFEALAIIKYFELRNNKVLVLCPKKLRENWTIYQAQNNSELNPFLADRFGFTVLCHSDLSRDSGKSGDIDLAAINWGNYDLVVIDESHNFRNNIRGKRDAEGNVIKRSRYERLMEDIIKRGVRTKVLLISATPVNTNLKDLRNQLYFLTEGNDSAFAETIGINSLGDTLATAQRTFTEWAKDHGEHKASVLMEKLSSSFFKLLDELTIARSRKHILKYYKSSIDAVGNFPKRLKPESIFSEIDNLGRFLSYDELNDQIAEYRLSLFRPSEYVKKEHQWRYEKTRVMNFTQKQREFFLSGMMKVNFLKRLESSISSFAITMQRTVDKIISLEKGIQLFLKDDSKKPNMDLDVTDLVDADEDETPVTLEQIGKGFIYELAHLDLARWLKDLERDRIQLKWLNTEAQKVGVSRDRKLQQLKALIEAKVSHPTADRFGKANRKLIVFTAFADTALYLYSALHGWTTSTLKVHIAVVSGLSCKTSFGKADYANILTNFAPIAKHRDKMRSMPNEGEIDILIATDCISEGQNLQDCDYLINYDIHWNPVRIIQRFGRIDRIGSLNPSIQLVNFWPTQDLNKYINLKNRVEARMALVDVAATNEDNLLDVDELQDLIKDELKYRDKQLLRLRNEVLDLEDFNETITLSDVTLDDFRIDLAKYIEANRVALEQASFGLYAVVPPHPDYPQIVPGIIWCLKQRGDTSGTETVNPLQPYYLAYVRSDGVVRYNFAQPKQTLEMFRLLCAGHTAPYETLCNLFDDRTQNGNDMKACTELLSQTVESITRSFKKRTVETLFMNRNAKLIDGRKQVQDENDFELVTWLVIQDAHDQR